MPQPNLFDELKEALADFKGFLDTNVPVIEPVIDSLDQLGLPVKALVTQLNTLLGTLRTKIQDLDLASIGGEALSKVSDFTGGVTALLQAAKNLLPDAADEIQEVLDAASVVTSLPSLDQVKTEILSLIDAISAHLTTLAN